MFQAASAFGSVQGALSWIVDRYDSIASWRAVVERLGTFHRAIEAARAGRCQSDPHRERRRRAAFARFRSDIARWHQTAGARRSDTDRTAIGGHHRAVGLGQVDVVPGDVWHLAITRAASIEVPKNMFFLPQKPYIPLGTLRYVITYPHDAASTMIAPDSGAGAARRRIAASGRPARPRRQLAAKPVRRRAAAGRDRARVVGETVLGVPRRGDREPRSDVGGRGVRGG